MSATSSLIHYTGTAKAVESILQSGFLLVPNKRHLINALVGEALFSDREPQEFGMVSFTQLPINRAATHRERFGAYGIAVSWDWALRCGAQRVIYVDERGPIAEAFAWLFRLAKQELDVTTAGRPDRMTLENKAFASLATSTMWSRLLNLYEYMEPERNSPQVEWRIVNEIPHYYQRFASREALVADLVQSAKKLRGFTTIPVTPDDVVALICPRRDRRAFRDVIPKEFANVPVITYRSTDSISKLARARDRALLACRARERVVRTPAMPPAGTIFLSHDANGAFYLPEVDEIKGARLFQDELMVATRVLLQYRSVLGTSCDLVVPLRTAVAMIHMVNLIWERSGLHPLYPLPPLARLRDLLVGEMRIGTSRPKYSG